MLQYNHMYGNPVNNARDFRPGEQEVIGLSQRQFKIKGGTLARRAFNTNSAVVVANDLVRDI